MNQDNYIILPKKCKCGCGNNIKVRSSNIKYYEKHGYPEFINHHNRKGIVVSDEVRQHMSEAQKISKGTMESRRKQSESHKGQTPWIKGKRHSKETIQKIKEKRRFQSPPTKGKYRKMPESWIKHRSMIMSGSGNPMYDVHMSGEEHWNWQGGISYAPYCPKFNHDKKEEIRNKYNRKCIICGLPESDNIMKNGKHCKLDVHHIDYNKDQGCENHEWRLVPLCLSCHRKTNRNHELWESKIKEILNFLDNKL